MDQAQQQDVDIAKGIESTLTMLTHKLKRGNHGGSQLRSGLTARSVLRERAEPGVDQSD